MNKEKLTVSGNDTSASNVVEMPLPPAQRRWVHSFVITRAFVKVKFNTGENLYRNCPTLLTALYKHVSIEKEQEQYGSNCKKVLREKLTRKDTMSNLRWVQNTRVHTLEVRSVCCCIKIALAFIPTTDSSIRCPPCTQIVGLVQTRMMLSVTSMSR